MNRKYIHRLRALVPILVLICCADGCYEPEFHDQHTTATMITSTSAVLNAYVDFYNSGNVYIRGFAYSKTAVNSDPGPGRHGVTVVEKRGNFLDGPFSESVTGLMPGTNYSFRAYVDEGHSNVVTFTTLP